MKYFIFTIFFVSTSLLAKPLTMMVRDPEGVIRPITYEIVNGVAITEGDIILANTQKLPKASVINIIGGGTWTDGIVPIKFSDNVPLATRQNLELAAHEWEKVTKVHFVFVNKDNKHVYKDYILVHFEDGTGCSSVVGKSGGKQALNLSTRCNKWHIVHELGHALGLWHEQDRADRDAYIQIAWDNIKSGHEYNFKQHLTDGKDIGPYNYDSIMHYSEYAFSSNGKKTIIPLTNNVKIGQRDHLSSGDIDAINELYQ